MLHPRTLCPTAKTRCLHRHPLQEPGDKGSEEAETGPLGRFTDSGWLVLKRLDLHSKRAANVQEREKYWILLDLIMLMEHRLLTPSDVQNSISSINTTHGLESLRYLQPLFQQVNEHQWACYPVSLWFSQYYSFFCSIRNLRDEEAG